MKQTLLTILFAAMFASQGLPSAQAWERRGTALLTPDTPCWHGSYYEAGWGAPVSLVVPPTAEYQTKWGWGVGNTRVVPIYHQFGRDYPGPYLPGAGFQATPRWPSDTDQFGVYYTRGPW